MTAPTAKSILKDVERGLDALRATHQTAMKSTDGSDAARYLVRGGLTQGLRLTRVKGVEGQKFKMEDSPVAITFVGRRAAAG